MKITTALICTLLAALLSGCASYWLHTNASAQARTVGDFMKDEALYNLAFCERCYVEESNNNAIPSFVRLQTGQAQVQQTVTGQLGVTLPMAGHDTISPQLTGAHQAQDNWTFAPVVDPAEVKRLYFLYRAEFVPTDTGHLANILANIFPTNPPTLDQQGRPYLNYTPVLVTNFTTNSMGTNAISTNVLIISNVPQFTATVIPPTVPALTNVPGAGTNMEELLQNRWFSFANRDSDTNWYCAGSYDDRKIWISKTNDAFFRFTLLTLGATNNLTGDQSSRPYFSIQNGLLIRLQ
jgi:hypothetical protein